MNISILLIQDTVIITPQYSQWTPHISLSVCFVSSRTDLWPTNLIVVLCETWSHIVPFKTAPGRIEACYHHRYFPPSGVKLGKKGTPCMCRFVLIKKRLNILRLTYWKYLKMLRFFLWILWQDISLHWYIRHKAIPETEMKMFCQVICLHYVTMSSLIFRHVMNREWIS